MGMNAQLHLILSSESLEKLRKEADKLGLTISKLCRDKLLSPPPLDRIELALEQINKKLTKRRKI